MFRFLIRQSTALGFIEALALLFGISWLDLATGHQVSLVLFYTVPIVAAVWLCDNKSVYVIAGLAGVLWSWADAAIGCAASTLKSDLRERGLGQFASKAAEIEKLLSDSVKQARDLSHGLVPVQFGEAGLAAALSELASATSRLLPVECTFESAGITAAGQNGKATHLYRIAQEAIHN